MLVSNLVHMMRNNPDGPTTGDIKQAFAETQQKRDARVRWLCESSHKQQYTAAKQEFWTDCLVRLILPFTTYDELMDLWQTTFQKGHVMDVFEVPKRKHCTPYADELPARRLEGNGFISRVAGLVTMILLCTIFNVGWRIILPVSPEAFQRTTFFGLSVQETNNSVPSVEMSVKSIDWAYFATSSGANINTRLECLYLLVNLAPLVYIWTIEGYRHGNRLSPVRFPVLFGVYQIFGIGVVAPVYYLLSLFATGSGNYTRPVGRVVPTSVAKALFPSIMLGYVAPTFMAFIEHKDYVTQQNVVAFWKPFPVYVALLTWSLSHIIEMVAPTESLPDLKTPEDLGHLMAGYVAFAAITAITHLSSLVYGYLADPVALWLALFDVPSPREGDAGGVVFLALLKWHMILCFAAVLVWLLYSVFDLRRLGYITTRTAAYAASAAVVGQVLVGPAATYAGLWAWREKLISELCKQGQ